MTREEAQIQNSSTIALFQIMTQAMTDVERLVETAYATLLGLEGDFSNAVTRQAYWIEQINSGHIARNDFAEEFLYLAENEPGNLTAEEVAHNVRAVPAVVDTADKLVTQWQLEGRSLEDLAPQEVNEAAQALREAIVQESNGVISGNTPVPNESGNTQPAPGVTGDNTSSAKPGSDAIQILSVGDVLATAQLPRKFEISLEPSTLYLSAGEYGALTHALGKASNADQWDGFAYHLYGEVEELTLLEDGVIQQAQSVLGDGFASFDAVQRLIELNSAWQGHPIVIGTPEQHQATTLIVGKDYLPGLQVNSDDLLDGKIDLTPWDSVYLQLQDLSLSGERLIELAQWYQSIQYPHWKTIVFSGSAEVTLEEYTQLDKVAPYFLNEMHNIQVSFQSADELPVLSMYEATQLIEKTLYPNQHYFEAVDIELPPFILEDHYHALTDNTRWRAVEARSMAEKVRVSEPVTSSEATELKRWGNFDEQSIQPLLSVTRDDANVNYAHNTYEAVGFSSASATLDTFFGETLIFRGDNSRVAFSNTSHYDGNISVVLRGSDNVLNLQGLGSGLSDLEVLLGSDTRENVIDAGQLSGDISLVTSQREWGLMNSGGESQLKGLKADSVTGKVEVSTQGKSFGLTGTFRADNAKALVLHAEQGNIVDVAQWASWQFNRVEDATLIASGGDIYLSGPMTLANGSSLHADVSVHNTVSLSRITLSKDVESGAKPDTFSFTTQGEGHVFISNESFRLDDNLSVAFETFTLVADAHSTSLWLDEVSSLVASGSGDTLDIASLFLTQNDSHLDFSEFSGDLSLNLRWFEAWEDLSLTPSHEILLGQGGNRIGNSEGASRDSKISVSYVFDKNSLHLELAQSFHGFPQDALFDVGNDVLNFSSIDKLTLSGMQFNGQTFNGATDESFNTFLNDVNWTSRDTHIQHEDFDLDILLAGINAWELKIDNFVFA